MNTRPAPTFIAQYSAFPLLVAICFTLLGCGGSSTATKNAQTQQPTQPEPISAAATTSEAPTRAPLTITLSWTAPLTRENGQPLTMGDISGYEIVGQSTAWEGDNITLATTDVTNVTFEDLRPADYAFSIYTFDNDNNRSLPSAPLTILESQFPLH